MYRWAMQAISCTGFIMPKGRKYCMVPGMRASTFSQGRPPWSPPGPKTDLRPRARERKAITWLQRPVAMPIAAERMTPP